MLRKNIIPLCLEADYTPDGWLGALCLNYLYYDFSNPEKFEDQWNRLRLKLKEIRPTASSCDTGLTVVSQSFSMLKPVKGGNCRCIAT